MGKHDSSPTYYKSLQLYVYTIGTKGFQRSVTLEETSIASYDKSDTGRKALIIRQELTVVEKGLLKTLSSKALKLVLDMMDDLYMNNALWHFEAQTSYDRSALKELRDKGLLIRTEDAHIHYVNPLMIRRGSPASVLAQTTELLRNVSRVSKALIRDLNYKNIRFNILDQIELPAPRESQISPEVTDQVDQDADEE